MIAHRWLVLSLFFALGCKGSNEASGAASAAASSTPSTATAAAAGDLANTPLTGAIFQIDGYTRNAEGCDREGASIMDNLNGDTHLFVYVSKTSTSPSGEIAVVATCKGEEACRRTAKAWQEKQDLPQTNFMASFIEKDGEDHWTGMLAMTGMTSSKPICREAMWGTTDLKKDGATLKATVRGAQADLPTDDQGRCTTMSVEDELKGKPCNRYDVLSAHVVASIAAK